jgi:RNA polymerase sigma factor (sigma-70 family)
VADISRANDILLHEKARAGDPLALNELFVRAFEVIARRVKARLGSGDPDVDDVTINACIRFWGSWSRWTAEGSLDDFARGVAKYTLLDHFGECGRRLRVRQPDRGLPANPEQETCYRQAWGIVSHALRRLPCQQRRALAGYVRGELQAQTAVRMGIARVTVAGHLRAARRAIRARLLESGFDELLSN